MPVEKQVVSFNVAKDLDALGIRRPSYFVWIDIKGKKKLLANQSRRQLLQFAKHGIPCYCAYTLAELGEILPDSMDIGVNARAKAIADTVRRGEAKPVVLNGVTEVIHMA